MLHVRMMNERVPVLAPYKCITTRKAQSAKYVCGRTPGLAIMHLGFREYEPLSASFIPFFGKPLIERSVPVQEY